MDEYLSDGGPHFQVQCSKPSHNLAESGGHCDGLCPSNRQMLQLVQTCRNH